MSKENIVRLEVHVKEVKFDDNGKEKKFLSYTTFTKDNVRMDVRFVKDATDKAPKEACYVNVNRSDMNISSKYRYPRLYVQDIQSIEPLERMQNDDLPF